MLTPRLRPLVLALLVVSAGSGPHGEEPEEPPPLPTTVVERAQARLVQIDVTLMGPPDVLEQVTREDFSVKVGGERLERFEVDRLCRSPEGGAVPGPTTGAEGGTGERSPAPVLGPTTFLFFFDQPHLTMAGRQEGIELVRELVPALVKDGNRALLVSSAEKLETVVDLTTDPEALLRGLRELEQNRDQWDLYAEHEDSRIEDVLQELGIGSGAVTAGKTANIQRALTLARQFYQEELWRAERDLRRFAMVLARLAAADPPKVAIYLADIMRTNAGEHFLNLFGEFTKRQVAEQLESRDFTSAGGPSMHAQLSFDQVVDQASALGVRLYTIEARGLATPSQGAPTTQRFRHAQETLASLAVETGGRSFLHGARASKIAEKIQADLSCLYLISFDPAGLPQDRPLRVVVEVSRPKVTAQVRGRLSIPSESAALTSRLLAAFAAPDSIKSAIPVRSAVIPSGYRDGSFMALVQVSVARSDLPGSTWDLGTSVITRGKVQETSGRLTVGNADVPVVLQSPVTFPPGPFEIVAVAHNVTTDGVASRQLDGSWPRPNAELAALGPIAVLQPARAAIQREDEVKTSGLIAFAEDEPVRIDRPTVLVSLVCKSSDVGHALRAERQLVGETAVDFDPMDLDLGKDRCALIRDVVRAGTMTPGAFRYKIRILDGELALTSGERPFLAWDGPPQSMQDPG